MFAKALALSYNIIGAVDPDSALTDQGLLSKYFGIDQFNPSKDRATCQTSWFQADEFAKIWRTSLYDVTRNKTF